MKYEGRCDCSALDMAKGLLKKTHSLVHSIKSLYKVSTKTAVAHGKEEACSSNISEIAETVA